MPKKPTSDEVWLALDQLRRALNDAYWEISDPQQGDRILALAQDVDVDVADAVLVSDPTLAVGRCVPSTE